MWQATSIRTLTIALCLFATPALADVAGTASVIDGDTIEVHGQHIRLHGIDAPEGRQLCRLDGKPWQCGEGRGEHPNRSTHQLMSAITVLSHGPWFARRLVRAGVQ